MDERNDIKFKKQLSQFKKDAKIKECFHFDHENCSSNIIIAHSIQRSGILNLIEEIIDNNSVIYSLLNREVNEYGQYVGFEPIGKKIASTFSGFCGYHDTELFKCIENNHVDIENDKHCFLLSYRGFAKDYHAKIESLKGYDKNELYNQDNLNYLKNDLIDGSKLGERDGKIVKNRLNEMLKNESYDELEYFSYTLDYMIPIATSASFTPDYSYSNILLNKSIDPEVVYEYVNLNIIPTLDGKTHILFSCLPEHEKSVLFINELTGLNDFELQRAISSIVIGYAENTFFSPKIWDIMSESEKKQILNELEISNPLQQAVSDKFFRSKLNLFDNKFRKIPANNL